MIFNKQQIMECAHAALYRNRDSWQSDLLCTPKSKRPNTQANKLCSTRKRTHAKQFIFGMEKKKPKLRQPTTNQKTYFIKLSRTKKDQRNVYTESKSTLPNQRLFMCIWFYYYYYLLTTRMVCPVVCLFVTIVTVSVLFRYSLNIYSRWFLCECGLCVCVCVFGVPWRSECVCVWYGF